MILLALVAAEVAALVLAVVHARGYKSGRRLSDSTAVINHDRNSHRPLVSLIAFAIASDVIHEALMRLVFTAHEHPLQDAVARLGWPALALYHLSNGVVMAWPASLAAAAWRVFGSTKANRPDVAAKPDAVQGPRTLIVIPAFVTPNTGYRWFARRGLHPDRSPHERSGRNLTRSPGRAIAVAWVLALAGMVVAHPLPRGWTQPVLHAWQLACVAVAIAAILRAWGRTWSRAGVAVGVLVAVELVVGILGAWGHDAFRQWDELARVPYAIGFGVIAGLQVLWLRRCSCQ